jgi:hypothetical protein
MHRRRRKTMASDSNLLKVHRREDQLATFHIKPIIFTLSCCASAEFFFLLLRQRRGAAGLGELQ